MPQQSAAQILLQSERQEREREARRVAGQNLYAAQATDPQGVSVAARAASVLGRAPMEIDEAAIEEARQRQEMDRLSQHHRTIQWLQSPENAAVGRDQVGSLMDMETAMRRPYADNPDPELQALRDRTPGARLNRNVQDWTLGVVRRPLAGLGTAIGSSVEGINTTGIRVLDRLGLGESGLADYFRTERDFGRRVSSGGRNLGGTLTLAEQQRGRQTGARVLPQTQVDTGIVGDVAEGAGQVGGSVLINTATGGFGTLPALFGQGVAQMDERVRADQARDGRTDYSVQDDLTLLGGGFVTSLSEKLGLDAILGRLPPVIKQRLTSRLADIFIAGAVEGTSEVAEGVGQNVLARELLGEDTGLLDGTVQGGTVGAAVGALTRALILTALPGRQHIADQARADMAVSDAQRFDQGADMVAGNPLLELAPERLREFLSGVSPSENVYVPAEAVATFFQSNPDLQDYIDEWDIRDQYETALASGSDIAIDAGTYLTKVAQSPAHESWRNEIRHGLEAMSVREAESFKAEGEEALTESFDAAISQAEEIGRAGAPTATVYQDLFSQMRAAGYTIDVAQKQATIAAAYFARRAERSGGAFADAEAAYRDANLSIRQEFPQSLRERMDRTDVLIEALRQARKPAGQRQMFGRSLAEFISAEGGITDTGGELASMGADQWHRGRPGTRRLIRSETGGKFGSDDVAARAAAAGYLRDGATGNDLFAALREEVAGRPVFSSTFERDAAMEENRQAIDDLEAVLANLGIDPNTASNAEIKAALDAFSATPAADGTTYAQGERGQISLSEAGAVITLFQSRDLSTFFHEFGHFSLDLLVKDAPLSDQAQADLDAALKYLGVATAEDIGVEQHELWARSLEAYLMEGKAPSLELKSVFKAVKAWMVSIYRTVRNLNAPLTDDVRSLFDRLLASEDQIAEAEAQLSLDSELSDLERETMSAQQQADYARLFSRARSDAESSMLERTMRALRRERTAEWKAEADAMRPEVALEIDDQPDMRAMNWLKTTKSSLNRDAVVRMLGDEAGLSLLPKGVPPLVTNQGEHPDKVAEASGYASGIELLNGLMDLQSERQTMKAAGDKRTVRAARIDREIEARLREQYGDPLSDGSIEEEAMAALHGERMDRAVASRWSVISRSAGLAPPPPLAAMRAWAAERIGSRTVREAKSGKYLRAERTAATAAQKALRSGNKVEAARQLQAQTINRLLYSEARKAEEFADTAVRRLSKLEKARTRQSMDQGYLEQIQGLLEQYDLRQASGRQVERRKALAQFVAEQAALGQEIVVPPHLLEAAAKRHYTDLTVDELRALDATVQALAKLGRLKKQLIVNGERRVLNDIAQQAVASAEPLPTIHKDQGFRKGDGWMAKLTDFGVAFEASLVKAQEWFRLLDGGDPAGIFATVLDKPANTAFVKLQELEAGFFEPVIAAERAIPKAVRARWLDVVADHPFMNPETADRLGNVQRRDLIAAALQTGNMSNFEIMAKGWGIVAKDADPVVIAAARTAFVSWLDGHLDPTEWSYVQAWWDGFERNQTAYFATARELNGYAPEPVESVPLATAAGTLAGGYVPVSYDARFDRLQQERDRADGADMFGGLNRTSPRPDNGSTKERSGYSGPVALDLDRIAEGARRHSRYIAYGEYIDNSLKFLRHPDVAKTIRDKLGPDAQKSMENWLAAQVKTDAVMDPNANAFVKAARWSRTNMTAALLLGSVNVLMAQPAGLAVSASTLGVGRLSAGMMKAAALMASGQFNSFVFSRSAIMRDRFEGAGLDRDIRLALTRNGGKRSKREMAAYLSGRAIAAIDVFVVSGPTWIAAYDKALAEGREEGDAVYIADKAAETAQGSGRASTLAAIQRDNEVTKMVTFAYGWANALYNVQRGSVVDIKNGVNRTHAIYQLAAVMLLPALADALISGDWPDFDDEDGKVAASAKWFARNTFFGAFSGIPIIRDFAGAAERKASGKYAGPVGQTALGRIGDEVSKLATDAWDFAFSEDHEPSRRWPAHFINSLGFVLGLPGSSQVARTTNYITDVNDGEQNPDGLLDWIAGLTKGPQKDQE